MKNEQKSTSQSTKNGKFLLIVIVLVAIIAIAVYALVSKTDNNEGISEEVATSNETSIEEGEATKEEEEAVVEDYVTLLSDETKLNTSDALAETKTLDGLEITNTQLTYETTGNSVLLADVTNTTDSRIEAKDIKIDILDEDGNIIMTLDGALDPVEAGETIQLNLAVSADIANAYDFTIYEA